MADELPMFPNAKSLLIHTGNIINCNILKRKPNQTSTDEICECVGKILGCYLESTDKSDLKHVTDLYKINSESVQKLDENEREEVKITVKVFVCTSQPASVISEVVDKVLSELGTTFVESLLLAVAPNSDDDDDDSTFLASLNTIQLYWEAMEKLVSADKVLSLGICDLTRDALENLYNWAKVKPCIDQVNLESCCVMPKDLTEYAKSINVQLLTHNDRRELIPSEKLQETIKSVSTIPDGQDWLPQWVVRYSGILKCRGIIQMKGYIFHALRDKKAITLNWKSQNRKSFSQTCSCTHLFSLFLVLVI